MGNVKNCTTTDDPHPPKQRGTYHEYNGCDRNANGAPRREKMRREGGLGAVVRENGRRERGVCAEWGRGKAVADLKGLLLLSTARPFVAVDIIRSSWCRLVRNLFHYYRRLTDGLAVGTQHLVYVNLMLHITDDLHIITDS
ncbi:hypothetical protein PIB30_093619 [Stylosanthes scabra]|uniref:Uncharacterized protein n=1 Tax=Stylosanthes scabra TaxID=79078 RepID=A0ABU6ZTT5_9FABA|nr:hypothetical protein [Stylosanthes scabra]